MTNSGFMLTCLPNPHIDDMRAIARRVIRGWPLSKLAPGVLRDAVIIQVSVWRYSDRRRRCTVSMGWLRRV